jgi:hypothetical protein
MSAELSDEMKTFLVSTTPLGRMGHLLAIKLSEIFVLDRAILSMARRKTCSAVAVLASSTVRLALSNLPHQRVHIGEVPDLGELAVFDAIKSELRNSHPTIGRLNSLRVLFLMSYMPNTNIHNKSYNDKTKYLFNLLRSLTELFG